MKLIPTTPLQVTLAVAVAVVSATATISWVCANGFRDLKEEIAGLRADVSQVRNEAWTYENQSRWVSVLAKENRFNAVEIPLVPERAPKKPN